MAGPDFSLLTGIVSQSMPSISGSVVGVFAAICALVVIIKAIGLVIEAIRGETVEFGGKRWDKDVWQAAMNDLNRQKRSGVLMDSDSRKAMRKHQGLK